ncbi:MAG: sulfotransferase family 2 domain-containing protein, partial [Candidatus Limnocylindrales bacterium]
MAMICREQRLLFIFAPHTGSTAIGTLLRDQFGGEWIPAADVKGPDGKWVRRKHTTEPELMRAGLLPTGERGKLLAFSAVRNPFDTLVSVYLKHSVKDQALLEKPEAWVHGRKRKLDNLEFCRDHTFDEWIEHIHGPRLRDRLRGRKANLSRWLHDEGMDVVMRYETLQADFDVVLTKAGIEGHHEIPKENVTSARAGRDYRTFYSKR